MTSQLIYEHSNGSGTLNFQTNSLIIGHRYENKGVDYKDGKVYQVYDANRVGRTFRFSTVLTRTDFGTLEGLLRPASAPDYTTAYPRFTKVYYGVNTSWNNVEVVMKLEGARIWGFNSVTDDWDWIVTLFAEEKND